MVLKKDARDATDEKKQQKGVEKNISIPIPSVYEASVF
jgi:hypothetical protein